MTRFASAIDTASEARSSRSLSRASHATAWVLEWLSRQWLLCSCHITGLASTFAFWKRVKLVAGDEIVKVADGPERITVADIDALLYLPNPSREQLERSLRVPALSQGWKTSLKAIAEQKTSEEGNPGLKASSWPATSLAGFSAFTRRQGRSRSCRCGLVVHRTNGRGTSACSSTRTVSRPAVAHNTQRPNAAPELLDVRHARRQDLSGKRQTRDERGCQLISLRSRTGGRYFGGERASGRFYSEIRRWARRIAQCGHRGNPRTRHVAVAVLRGVTSSGLVDLRSA